MLVVDPSDVDRNLYVNVDLNVDDLEDDDEF